MYSYIENIILKTIDNVFCFQKILSILNNFIKKIKLFIFIFLYYFILFFWKKSCNKKIDI